MWCKLNECMSIVGCVFICGETVYMVSLVAGTYSMKVEKMFDQAGKYT